jgi:hypothetical protein
MRFFFFLAFFITYWQQTAYAAGPPWKFTLSEGETEASIGFLAQPQFETLQNNAGNDYTNSLFIRRFRLVAGGRITSKLSFFIESESANLGKKKLDGRRTADIYLADAYVSYAFRPEFQLTGGMLLTPVSHNSGQSTVSLLPIDFGPYSFLASDPTHSKKGRDYGLEARGYIKKHFEYRFGLYRGNTDHDGAFPYRYLARFVWYPFEADTAFFYTGPTFGQKKIVGIGVSFDRQGNYSANSMDVFIDYPLKNGDAVTFQGDFIRYDGGTTFESLPKQNTWLLEGSYYIRKAKLGPFVQLASRDYVLPDSSDEMKLQGGVAYWILQHQMNIKAGLSRLLKTGSPDRSQFVIQAQFFYY